MQKSGFLTTRLKCISVYTVHNYVSYYFYSEASTGGMGTTTPNMFGDFGGGNDTGGNDTMSLSDIEADIDWSSLIETYMKDQEFNR